MNLNHNLNIDSFRAMVGNSTAGEVRLGADGGLEKINNHGLQRLFSKAKTAVDAAESHYIRQAFLASVSDEVDNATYCAIREKLGISRGSATGDRNSDVYDKPLSRRDIRDILRMADRNRMENTRGADGAAVVSDFELDFKKNGIACLRKLIEKQNAIADRTGGGKVNLTDAELKMLAKRYSRELFAYARGAKSMKALEGAVVFAQIRRLVSERKVDLSSGGKMAVWSRAERRDAQVSLEDSFYCRMETLGVDPARFVEIRNDPVASLRLGLTKADFKPVAMTVVAENVHYDGSLRVSDPDAGPMLDAIERQIWGSGLNNMRRDTFDITAFGEKHDRFVRYDNSKLDCRNLGKSTDPADAETVRALSTGTTDAMVDAHNRAEIEATLRAIRGTMAETGMTVDQYNGVTRIFQQTIYATPMRFGFSSSLYRNRQVKIERKYDDVIVSFDWTDAAEPSAGPDGRPKPKPVDMSLCYRVMRNGLVQVEYLKALGS